MNNLDRYTYIMQLFIGPFNIQWHSILIHEEEIINQCRRVLRAWIGYEFYIQSSHSYETGWNIVRYHVWITDLHSKELTCKIIDSQSHLHQPRAWWVVIWIPNKMDKIELIVQKLTELGVGRIVFTQMKRSVLPHAMSENKLKRLDIIVKEAAEQSRRFTVPHILFEKKIEPYLSDASMIFDTQWSEDWAKIHWIDWIIVGPEWWYDQVEMKLFDQKKVQRLKLPTPILRTETAAIIAWRKRNEYNTSS